MAKRTDANQELIVGVLRRVGASVTPLHMVGSGCPHLVVGFQGINYLLEVKDGDKPPSKQQHTIQESVWHARWRGQVATVTSVDEALRVIGAEFGAEQ